jgi:hypothetical protein
MSRRAAITLLALVAAVAPGCGGDGEDYERA